MDVAWFTWPNFKILGPFITFELLIRLKFGSDIEDGPLLRVDHKTTLSGRGLGHVTHFRNFGTPYNF